MSETQKHLQHLAKQMEGARRFEFEILTHSKDPNEEPEHPGEWQVRPLQGALMFDGRDGPLCAGQINQSIGPYILKLHRAIADDVAKMLRDIRSMECAARSGAVADVCLRIKHLTSIQRSPVRSTPDDRAVDLDSGWCFRAASKEQAQQVADDLNELIAPFVSQYIQRIAYCMQDALGVEAEV